MIMVDKADKKEHYSNCITDATLLGNKQLSYIIYLFPKRNASITKAKEEEVISIMNYYFENVVEDDVTMSFTKYNREIKCFFVYYESKGKRSANSITSKLKSSVSRKLNSKNKIKESFFKEASFIKTIY